MNNKNKLPREAIAMRVTKELHNGNVVNLGIGIPTLCPQFIDSKKFIMYHSESGVLNYGEMASEGEEDTNLINAGGQYLSWNNPGISVFDSAESFAMIRGGHIDVAVLGAYQISAQGDLANWKLVGPVWTDNTTVLRDGFLSHEFVTIDFLGTMPTTMSSSDTIISNHNLPPVSSRVCATIRAIGIPSII